MRIRSRIALLIVVLFLLGTGTIAAYQSYPKTITLIDNGKATQYETTAVLVEEFLASENIQLSEKDNLSVDNNESITQGMEIIITRWNPTVTLILNQKETKMNTKAYTVGQLIYEQEIELGEKGVAEPGLITPIKDGMTITVQTEEKIIEMKEGPIPYETKVTPTADLKPGERQVKVEGKEGLANRTFEVVRFNGEIIEETQIKSQILVEPETEVILEGMKNIIVDPKTGKSYEYTKEMMMEATAYTDIPNDKWYGITASGMPTFVGMVAVDKNVIPLGTRLYVEGYGIAHAGDTGGAVKGNIIDLYMNSKQETRAFGRRPRKVYILRDQTINVRAERATAVAKGK